MFERHLRAVALFLGGVLPLVLFAPAQDVVFGPWRAALWAGVGCIACLAGYRWLAGRSVPVLHFSVLPWILFSCWALVATLWSVNPADSFRRTLDLAGAVMGLWLGIAVARRWERLRDAALASMGLCSLYGMAQVAGMDWLSWASGFPGRAFGTMGNPDYFAGHLLLVLPLGFALAVTRPRARPFVVPLVLLFLAGLLLSQVRGAWLAAGAAAAWAGFWLARRGGITRPERRLIGGAIVAGVTGFLIALAVSEGVRWRLRYLVDVGGHGATGRRYLWAVAANMWMDRWATGFGTGSFRFEFPRYQHIGASMGPEGPKGYGYSEHAHSEVLQFGAETGAVGAGLFLWGLLAWGWRWAGTMRRSSAPDRRDEWWTQLGLGTALFGIFAYGWVNLPLQVVPTAALFWLLMGVSLGRMREPDREWRPPRTGAVLAALAIGGLGIAGAVVSSTEMVGSVYLRGLTGQLTLGNHPLAFRFGRLAARLLPHDYRVFLSMAELGIATRDAGLVEESVTARLKVHPYRVDALADRADLALRLGDVDLAAERFGEIVARVPNFARGWQELGKIWFEKGEHDRAASAFAKLEEVIGNSRPLADGTPNLAPGWGELGRRFFERGDYRGALDAFSRAAAIEDGSAMWHHNVASCLGMLKRFREALEADRRAIDRDPGFVGAHVGMALSFLALGDRAGAADAVRRAYRLDPRDPQVHQLLQKLPEARGKARGRS